MRGPVSCWTARPHEFALPFIIRHRVFVEEQGVLVFTDVDARDRHPATISVLASIDDQVAGTVRLYPIEPEDSGAGGRWRGDRLAVLPPYRSSLVGARLVRHAVATAASAGGDQMEASVQVANVVFFERLGWRCDGEARPYLGLLHQPMLIDLSGVAPASETRPAAAGLRASRPADDCSPLLVGV